MVKNLIITKNTTTESYHPNSTRFFKKSFSDSFDLFSYLSAYAVLNYLPRRYRSPKIGSINFVSKRTMLSAKSFITTATVFNLFRIITDQTVLNDLRPKNHQPFDEQIASFALDHTSGSPHHKRALLTRLFTHQFNIRTMYNASTYRDKITVLEGNGPSTNVITELPTIDKLFDTFGSTIDQVIVTSDNVPVIVEGQKQSNLDFIISIISNSQNKPRASPCKLASIMDNILGLRNLRNIDSIVRAQDSKDGLGMFTHSSRGSLGLQLYDYASTNIQTSSYPITEEYLFAYHKQRLLGLSKYLESNQLLDHFKPALNLCFTELHNPQRSIFDRGYYIENILWHQIQRDPLFDRSVGFVFIHKTEFSTSYGLIDDKFQQFQLEFLSKLDPQKDCFNPYKLDKLSEAKTFLRAAFLAYAKIDPLFLEKLQYLHLQGVSLTTLAQELVKLTLNQIHD